MIIYNIITGHEVEACVYSDEYLRIHIYLKGGTEFVSNNSENIRAFISVLQEENPENLNFFRMKLRYAEVPKIAWADNIALSAYTGGGKSHFYIHNLDRAMCIAYVSVDCIVERDVTNLSCVKEFMILEEPGIESEIKISERVRYFREVSGLKIAEASLKSGISYRTWASLEDGTAKCPSFVTLSKICKGLNITLREFFFDSSDWYYGIQSKLAKEILHLSAKQQEMLALRIQEWRINENNPRRNKNKNENS